MSLQGTLISAHSDHRVNDIHIPRTQREAGIELSVWEDRAAPLKSYLRLTAEMLGIVATVISLFIICLAVGR
jgi:hypothetical protein